MLDRLGSIGSDSGRIADLPTDDRLGTPVPSCPGWSIRDLVIHLGQVQQFWAHTVLIQDTAEPWGGEVARPGSETAADLADWLRSSTSMLTSALRQAGDDAPAWTWWDTPGTSGAIARHQVQEAAVHRWDAEAALGLPHPLDHEVAIDGVAEFLEVLLGQAAEVLPGSVELVSTDGGHRWIAGPDEPPSATVEGSASDLVLLLYGRLTPAEVTVVGDGDLVDLFLDASGTK
jgi:uncharacterized protein (TIGR03083 family)